MKDLGMIESHDDINQYIIAIGDERFYNMKPIHGFNIFGLLEYKDEIHFMCADDGHYWSEGIVNPVNINKFREFVCMLENAIDIKKSRIIIRNKKLFRNNDYCCKIDGKTISMIFEDINLTFDIAWLPVLIKTLDIE